MTTAYAIKCRTWGENRLCQEMLFARGFRWRVGGRTLVNESRGQWIIARVGGKEAGVLTQLCLGEEDWLRDDYIPTRIVDIAKWPKVEE